MSKVPGSFGKFDATLVFDKENPSASSAEATISVGSVNTNDAKRDAHLQKEDFFLAEKFPSIAFKSKSWKKTGEDTYDVVGDLTIKDVTKEITLVTKFLGTAPGRGGKTLSGWEGTTKIDRRDFGITYGPGVVGNDVDITINLEAPSKATALRPSLQLNKAGLPAGFLFLPTLRAGERASGKPTPIDARANTLAHQSCGDVLNPCPNERMTADELQTLIEEGTLDYTLGENMPRLRIFARATQAAPDSFEAWHALAEVNFSLRRLDPALAAAERAHALKPGDLFINTTLSRIWMERGDKAQGRAIRGRGRMLSWKDQLKNPADYQGGLS